ncbi:MAG: Asp-tRNA(Asn)/Glu-tRNA(Gln) amidotransferase subunit GatB [Thaumarchaeota archaeon]|nr:Asp-tRNA(Asn)/Glu-tRNA(Gln) amidotransferase subunit GatB [Nitrososphaerota archaeon]
MGVDGLGLKIGLEVHCQLTVLNTKLFCSCSSNYRGTEPNTNICEICTGLPGTLPVLNEKAVEAATKIALALNCKIAETANFFRKNYFYPDLPKNFQITQYDKAGGVAIAKEGQIGTSDGSIRIRRIQLEEDPGKLSYEGTIVSSPFALVDYNRAGVALVEIVTEPDLKSPKNAREFLQKLRSILEHIGVCDGSLEGAMRCDANISLFGGKRVEVKNISSFKEVERALNFEITRQKTMAKAAKAEGMETRHWDEVRRVTVTLRVKESEEDYRYFPEPDLVPITISKNYISKVKARMPELPDKRKERFVRDYKVSEEIASVLVGEKQIADFFEACVKSYTAPRLLGSWLAIDIIGYLNRSEKTFADIKFSPNNLAEIAKLVEQKQITDSGAKTIIIKAIEQGKSRFEIGKKEEGAITDEKMVMNAVKMVFGANRKAVEDAKSDPNAINFLMGQVMKATKGRADHSLARKLIQVELLAVQEPSRK